MDLHEHSQQSDDEYSHLDDKAFTRMIEKSIGLGEPTEIEQRVMSESLSYRHQTDSAAARQVSQAIYSILLPQKIQEVKDEEIFQNFRPPAVGADDPLLTAPAKTGGYVFAALHLGEPTHVSEERVSGQELPFT
ncbi:hypothetical protein FRC10_012204 [Ceratobasidium sp. 414]|nr:hypothetical protein FRC10_012204 [Ceratobasidium sp. 414]